MCWEVAGQTVLVHFTAPSCEWVSEMKGLSEGFKGLHKCWLKNRVGQSRHRYWSESLLLSLRVHIVFCLLAALQTQQSTKKLNPKFPHIPQLNSQSIVLISLMSTLPASRCIHPSIHPGTHSSRGRSGLHLTCHIHHDRSSALLPKCQRTQSCRKTVKHKIIMF